MTEIEDKQTLGEYIKTLERMETDRKAYPGQAVYIRIDGNRFSKFTRGMIRPFDQRMHNSMVETTKSLMKNFGAVLGYTQSDEISLVLWQGTHESILAHGGKFQKLVSRTASHATSVFRNAALNNELAMYIMKQEPEFDSRAYSVSRDAAMMSILWRMIDAQKNAIQMVAQHYLPHAQLQGKHGDQQLQMLKDIHVDYDSYPRCFRLGTLLTRVHERKLLTPEELENIPEEHRPTEPVLRKSIVEIDHPNLRTHASRLEFIQSLEKETDDGSS